MENKQTRIKDIAEKAGVSVGTVDRVLHNRGEVSPHTRKRVLNIVAELEYQPNFLASTLASKKNYRFGVLIPAGSDQNPYWNFPLKGVVKAGEELKPYGITLDVKSYSSTSTKSFRELSGSFIDNPPDGLLVAPVFYEESKRFLLQCDEIKLPIVFIDTQMEYPHALQFIGQNSCQSGHVAARLLGMGQSPNSKYLVFNVIGEKDQLHHFRERSKGFQDYFSSRNLSADILIYDVNRTGMNEITEILTDHLSSEKAIAGIFVTGSQAYRLASALEELKRPDIRLLGFDLVEQNLTYLEKEVIDFLISQQPEEQAYLGIQTLYSVLLQNQEINPLKFTPIDIITRENIAHYINCP